MLIFCSFRIKVVEVVVLIMQNWLFMPRLERAGYVKRIDNPSGIQ